MERQIPARVEAVWQLISEPGRWLQWQGTQAQIVPEPGGVHLVNIRGDAFVGGTVFEVVPNKRISFTWGFDVPDHPLPLGSTLVVIDLEPSGEGTLLRLTHQQLPDGFTAVKKGWDHYLDRLVIVGGGGDPGPDPLVGKPT